VSKTLLRTLQCHRDDITTLSKNRTYCSCL